MKTTPGIPSQQTTSRLDVVHQTTATLKERWGRSRKVLFQQFRRLLIVAVIALGLTFASATVANAGEPYVSVPKGYKFNRWNSLRDYCSWSPDYFTTYYYKGRVAKSMRVSWKGPCARHDICYQKHSRKYKSTCDKRFLADLRTNCRWRFKSGSIYEKRCYSEAKNYYWWVKKYGDG